MFDEKTMRRRFHDLTAKTAAIEKKAAPLRAKRDEHVNKARDAEVKMNAEIAKAEEGLFDMQQERAMIVRALKGQTGSPDAE